MRQRLTLIGVLTSASVLFAAAGFAQNVQYSGTLRIGFGDGDNPTDLQNNAIPGCAATNPFIKQTFGTLLVNGRASQTGSGKGAAITFDAFAAGNGGAQVKTKGTCIVSIPGFVDPQLRSRIQRGSANWPSDKGAYTTMYLTAPPPATPPSYRVSAGGGMDFAGGTLTTPYPFFGTGFGSARFVKGTNNFGGAVPYQGGGVVELGINTASTFGGATLVPGDYGLVEYVNGFLPTEPQLFGTGVKGAFNQGTTTTFANGIIVGQNTALALRTPGGTTRNQQGAIKTLAGGNTRTPFVTTPIPLVSPFAFDGAFFEWTTGQVRHSDMLGIYVTIRTATGFDVSTAGPSGTTRRLQLVTPFGANIEGVGPFGFPVPPQSFGGLAVLTLNIIPVPEPGSLAMVGIGALGLLGLGVARRRRR